MTIDVALRHEFGSFTLDVGFRIERPGITALFGPSGAGKTTIVNAVAGLFHPREGRIAIGGRVLLDTKAGIRLAPRLRRIGYVFQEPRLFPHLTVEGNLRFGWRRAKEPADAAEFSGIVDMLGLAPFLARRPAKLSGGEKGRVALGRALLSSPSLLLLDEPLAALDAARKAEILPYFERLRDEAKLPMVYVTHSLEEVSRLADHVIVVREGRVVAQGGTFDLASDLAFAALAGAPAYGAVLDAGVCNQHDDGLTSLSFDGGVLLVPRIDRPLGTRLRVRLRAEDIMLAREAPGGISANNILLATVVSVPGGAGAHADIQLRCGTTKLVARITRASQQRLGISPGQTLYAIVKSVTVDLRPDPLAGQG
jgi:molybdate transport system ATP-binding protein